MRKKLTAAIQLQSGTDKSKNIENATRLIQKAASRGARLISLPELFNWNGQRKEIPDHCEPIPGPTSDLMSKLATSLKVYILCGSILETNPHASKPFNTCFLIDPKGTLRACYRKIHLFKLVIHGTHVLDEQSIYSTGNEIKTAFTAFGKVGFSNCYDLRFPELYRTLTYNGAKIIFVPSAFPYETGKSHWETLLRARAIENQVYIIAPNQFGKDPNGNKLYGHSMIVDPWGTVIASATNDEKIIYAELDLEYLNSVRNKLPSLKHKRTDIAF